MENVCERIGCVPRRCKVGTDIHLIVTLDERREEQSVKVL